MPVRNNAMACTVINNKCYLVRGVYLDGVVFSIEKKSLPCSDVICGDLFTLLEGAIKHTSTHAWTVLQGCPNRGSMASKIGGALIILGGKMGSEGSKYVSSIYNYIRSIQVKMETVNM